jgi:hypothetical protein
MSRIKLTTPNTISVVPLGKTVAVNVSLEELLASMELGSDIKYIRVNGNLFTHASIISALEDASSASPFGLVEVGAVAIADGFSVSYSQVLNSIKKFGYGPIIPLLGKRYLLKTILIFDLTNFTTSPANTHAIKA